ncbi:MAG TPA: acyl carrier protein [Devosia sp.]|uniref:acyl carrier protein n=1 Tax=Devosia sp. TaxID=1871048 RepID=UPI002DDCB7D2|nr:acyl carrier protein [Devosia sp.]HEV2515885.1 acyl carrier protein [Devosia sp.]
MLSLDEVCAFVKEELRTGRAVLPDSELYCSFGCAEEDAVDLLVALQERVGIEFPDEAFEGYREFAGSWWETLYLRWRKRRLRRGITPRYLHRLIEAGGQAVVSAL